MQASETIEDIIRFYPEVTGIHPACTAVPPIDAEDRVVLNESIANDGLRHEILLTKEGLLIDGRNRLIACYHGKVEPRFRKVSTDPWQLAFAENIARRHLDTKRKAAFGLAWREHEKEAAKDREKLRKGNQPGAGKCGNISTLEDTGKARDKIGERVGVSRAMTSNATSCRAKGCCASFGLECRFAVCTLAGIVFHLATLYRFAV